MNSSILKSAKFEIRDFSPDFDGSPIEISFEAKDAKNLHELHSVVEEFLFPLINVPFTDEDLDYVAFDLTKYVSEHFGVSIEKVPAFAYGTDRETFFALPGEIISFIKTISISNNTMFH